VSGHRSCEQANNNPFNNPLYRTTCVRWYHKIFTDWRNKYKRDYDTQASSFITMLLQWLFIDCIITITHRENDHYYFLSAGNCLHAY